MAYTTQNWNDYIHSVFTSPFAQALGVMVIVAVALLLLSVVGRRVNKAISAPAQPKLSRAARRGLERDGYIVPARVRSYSDVKRSKGYAHR